MSDKRGTGPITEADEAVVSRAYDELKQAVPPAHLDNRILAAARREAADPNNVVIEVQRWRKWTMPIALAATVIFAVPLVVRVFELTPPDAGQSSLASKTESARIHEESVSADELAPRPRRLAQPQSGFAAAPPQSRLEHDEVNVLPNFPAENIQGMAVSGEHRESVADTHDAMASSAEKIVTERPAVMALSESERDFDDSLTTTSSVQESQTVPVAEQNPGQRSNTTQLRRKTPGLSDTDGFDARVAYAAEAVRDNQNEVENVAVSSDASAYRKSTGHSPDTEQEPEKWLDNIADQYRQGQVQHARRDLGTFLTVNPGYPLAADYPLQARDALYDDVAPGGGSIVPDATSWLRGIEKMARRGETDLARTQLARFFRINPDYPLPVGFPLTRADALPIER